LPYSSCELFATRMVLAKHLRQRRRVTKELQAHGLRMTRQRRVIAEVLQKAGEHLDAQEVLRRAREHMPGLHLATVYRILESLKKLGIIDELDLMHIKGTGHYYEARTERDHMHFTCQRCGGVLEIQTPLFERLKGQIEGRHGLAIRVARLELGELCGRCASKEETGGRVLA
jgi:Fe2+ or Zn2+ uptake regulation protein